jgi:hypothetical protein
MLPNKTWAIYFANKHIDKRPKGMTGAEHVQDGSCKKGFSNCKHKEATSKPTASQLKI